MLFTLKDRHSPFTGGVFLFVMTGVFLLKHTGVFLFGLASGNQFIIYRRMILTGVEYRYKDEQIYNKKLKEFEKIIHKAA